MPILLIFLTLAALTLSAETVPPKSPETGRTQPEVPTHRPSTPVNDEDGTIRDGRHLSVVRRREWVASPPSSVRRLRHPVEYVIISHSATDPCTTRSECTLTVRFLQAYHTGVRKWMDIAYNFLVGGDGVVYEGRGWDTVGAHSSAAYNANSIGISFIGTFEGGLPSPSQISACRSLIGEGVRLGKISPDYKLRAAGQVSDSGSPGQELVDELRTWDNWTDDA